MYESPSPFLHREERKQQYKIGQNVDKVSYEKYKAKLTLEKLRYHYYVRRGSLRRYMQVLGDFGRKHFGFLDPKQTGGGWW